MATDVLNQHATVIAKDLLIAAIEAKNVSHASDIVSAAREIGEAYQEILKAVRAGPKTE